MPTHAHVVSIPVVKKLLLTLSATAVLCWCGKAAAQLEDRAGILYLPDEETPYSGAYEKEELILLGAAELMCRIEAQVKDGRFIGTHKTFYVKNGKQALETTYKDGEKNGPYKAWWVNGQKWQEGFYKSGKKSGLWESWNYNGMKQQHEIYRGLVRDWEAKEQDKTFTVNAELLDWDKTHVFLKRTDNGKKIKVPGVKLSDEDKVLLLTAKKMF